MLKQIPKNNNRNNEHNNRENNKIKKIPNDDKLKVLSPSLRQKKRFIKIKIEGNERYEFKKISEKLNEQILTFLGIIEYGKSGIWILREKFDYEKQELVIRVSTKTKEKLIGILSLIDKIENKPINIRIVKISGTLKGLTKKN